jgi:hypothetical protein
MSVHLLETKRLLLIQYVKTHLQSVGVSSLVFSLHEKRYLDFVESREHDNLVHVLSTPLLY